LERVPQRRPGEEDPTSTEDRAEAINGNFFDGLIELAIGTITKFTM
jgi:hypothetical protein